MSVLGSDNDGYGSTVDQCSETCMNIQVLAFIPLFKASPCSMRGFEIYNHTETMQPVGAPVESEFHIFGRKTCAAAGLVYVRTVGANGAESEFQCSEFCVPPVAVAATPELEEGFCVELGFLNHMGNKEVTMSGFPTTVSIYEVPVSCDLTCSGHGMCKVKGDRQYCDCDDGWLTSDCSVQTLTHLKGVPSQHTYDWTLTGKSLHYHRPADKSIDIQLASLAVRRPSLVANGVSDCYCLVWVRFSVTINVAKLSNFLLP